MRRTVSIIGFGILLAGALVPEPGSARAETVLRFNNFLPRNHFIRKDGWGGWADQVAKVTNGRVKVEFTTKSLGALNRVYDLVRNGVADVGWGVQGYTPGRFVSAEAVEWPYSAPTAEALSVAYWRVYKKHFEAAGEYKHVHLLGLHTHSPGDIFTAAKPMTKMADMKGLKIRIVNPVTNQVLQMFGGAPVREPMPKLGQLLSKGVVDGSFATADGVRSFRLVSKLGNWLQFNGGIYNTSFFMAVNKAKWQKIAPADRKAIMSVSGEAFARHMGILWDKSQVSGIKQLKANGVKVGHPTAAETTKIKSLLGAVEKSWLKRVKAKGIDGTAALKMLRAEVAAYKAK